MIIEINIPEWVAYIGVMIIAMWAADKTLLLIKKGFEWRIKKSKRFELKVSSNLYKKGEILKTSLGNSTTEYIVVIREKYSRWWEKLICWLSRGKYFNRADKYNPTYIVQYK